MKTVNTKKVVLELADALPRLLPRLKICGIRYNQRCGSAIFDLIVDVETSQRKKRRLFVDFKQFAAPGRVREGLRQLKTSLPLQQKGYPIFASAFLSPRVQEICREEGVGYLDMAGNCFLDFDGLYLEKVVDKNPFPRRGRPSSLFTPISSRIIRALLEKAQRTWQVGELAQETGVSLGQTSKIARRLLEEEYLSKVLNKLQLTQPGKLLDDWQAAYKFEANERKGFYYSERDTERVITAVAEVARAHGLVYAVTSFAAAALVAPFVRGIGLVEWYIEDKTAVEGWVASLDLRPVEAGPNVVLLVPYDRGVFYRTQEVNGITLVGNIQMYIDLYSNPARGKEQAEFLRKEKLRF